MDVGRFVVGFESFLNQFNVIPSMSRRDLSITGNGSGLNFQDNNRVRPEDQSGASCQRL